MAKHIRVNMRVESNERVYCDKCKGKIRDRAYLLVYPNGGRTDAVYGDCCVDTKEWMEEKDAG